MSKTLLSILMLLLWVFPAAAHSPQAPANPATQDSFTIPLEARHQVNPVKPTPESIAHGKKYYGYDCAMCHGNKGDGKGEVAIDEKLAIVDFSDTKTMENKTDGELLYMIKNGHGHMPPERIRSSPNDLWDLVNYVRSFSNKKAQ